jgi:lipopolysaccharide transport system permease protein
MDVKSTGANQELIIEAGRAERQYWQDIWRYRELFYFLAWRDILVRYKQTAIGIAWALIRPFITMIVFTVVFGNLAKLPSEGVPYPILVFSAMLPWQFFSNALSQCSNSLIANSNLISKVYFPRLIIPISSIAVSFAASMGAGLLFASLNVKYRDFGFIVPFIIQIGLYISPVGFSSNIIPEQYRLLYSLNPMVGVIDGFRWSILGGESKLYLPGFLLSLGLVLIMLLAGIVYFRKMERTFADVI